MSAPDDLYSVSIYLAFDPDRCFPFSPEVFVSKPLPITNNAFIVDELIPGTSYLVCVSLQKPKGTR